MDAFTKWLKEQEIYNRIPPAFLTSSVISDYLDNMVTVRGNTKLTADKKRSALMVLYKFLMERGVVDKNPVVETDRRSVFG